MATERARTLGVSIGVHLLIAGLLTLVGGNIVLPQRTVDVEFELSPEPEPEPEPIPEPEPEPEPAVQPEIPTVSRPVIVPEKVKVVKATKPRPFQENATEEGTRDAPDDAVAVAAPTAPLTFAMTETVGGGSGLEYSSTTGGDMSLAPPGRPGGGPGAVANQGAHNVKVARDWQISREAKPLNDKSIEPEYPPLAKRQGREAVVVVRVDIDASGVVVGATAIEGPSTHGFREAAVAYTRKLRFEPAHSGDTPVASRIEWSVHFYVRN